MPDVYVHLKHPVSSSLLQHRWWFEIDAAIDALFEKMRDQTVDCKIQFVRFFVVLKFYEYISAVFLLLIFYHLAHLKPPATTGNTSFSALSMRLVLAELAKGFCVPKQSKKYNYNSTVGFKHLKIEQFMEATKWMFLGVKLIGCIRTIYRTRYPRKIHVALFLVPLVCRFLDH